MPTNRYNLSTSLYGDSIGRLSNTLRLHNICCDDGAFSLNIVTLIKTLSSPDFSQHESVSNIIPQQPASSSTHQPCFVQHFFYSSGGSTFDFQHDTHGRH